MTYFIVKWEFIFQIMCQNGWSLQDPCELSTRVLLSVDWASDPSVEFLKNTDASAFCVEIFDLVGLG